MTNDNGSNFRPPQLGASRRWQLAGLFAAGLGLLGSAQAALALDGCTLSNNIFKDETARMLALPPVTQTNGDDPNGNTGYRAQGALVQTVGKVDTVTMVALESDVAIYMYEGDSLSGKGSVGICSKGKTCSVVGINGRMRSAMCQREFSRNANVKPRDNPIIDLKAISDGAVATVKANNFPHLKWVNATTTWQTGYEYCKNFATDPICARYPQNKYYDFARIHVWGKIETGPRDVEWSVDFYGRFTAGRRFGFKLHRTSYSVWGSGPVRENAVRDALKAFLRQYNVEADVRNRMIAAGAVAGVRLDGMDRVQLTYLVPPPSGVGAGVSFDTRTTHPKLVLNRTRSVGY